MSFPSFLLPGFAIAGLVAAAGPLLIHLLNRQRFRVVEWAAMDFLRQAIFRSRRILRLRDFLLLLLRMACLILFGAALARPFFTRSGATLANPDQPVHAVVLLDNSMSMGYQKLDGILLDDAKAKAKEVIERLPRGSRVSVLPTCGSPRGIRYEPYSTAEEALEALATIEPVDRAMRPHATIDLALEACRRLSTMPAKRIVLVADQQVAAWPAESLADHLKQLPCPMEVLQVAPDVVDNAWIEDFKLRDGIADMQTPATLVATIRYQGPLPRKDVQVTLTIEGTVVATQTVDLEPGQTKEVEFPPYRFDVAAEPGKPSFVTAEVSIPHDRLPADDQRYLVVPVVAALPVVFVDSLGSDENARQNRYGETFFLRRLLAPLTSRTAQERQLIEVRHVRPDQVSPETLADARLVVVAGIASPTLELVQVLQEYVAQGGNLVLAAGGDFDPAAWTAAAWSGGLGILPAPLGPATIGRLPEESAGQLEPFLLDFDSLVHEYFLPEGTAEEELKAMYGPPALFFKAVAAETGPEAQQQVAEAVSGQLKEQRSNLAQLDKQLADLSRREAKLRGTDATLAAQRAGLEQQRAQLRPNWLLWRHAAQGELDQRPIEELVERAKPKVMGRFTNGWPFLVRRQWGDGQVLLICTGVSPGWNTLPVVRQAVWVYDRVFRSMLLETFPPRNISSERSLLLPIAPADRSARFALVARDVPEVIGQPGGQPASHEQPLSVDALGGDRYGITLGNWMRRGVYRVTAARVQDSGPEALEAKLWEIPIAVNGPADESQLARPEGEEQEPSRRAGFAEATQAGAALAEIQGTDLWKWGLAAVMGGLLLELVLLAWWSRSTERKA
ncbi:MAG: BatA domain-containing protein [Thermoguttaceae bacterium]